jgi:hypothetical protein
MADIWRSFKCVVKRSSDLSVCCGNSKCQAETKHHAGRFRQMFPPEYRLPEQPVKKISFDTSGCASCNGKEDPLRTARTAEGSFFPLSPAASLTGRTIGFRIPCRSNPQFALSRVPGVGRASFWDVERAVVSFTSGALWDYHSCHWSKVNT